MSVSYDFKRSALGDVSRVLYFGPPRPGAPQYDEIREHGRWVL